MNIQQAGLQIKRAMRAYFKKDAAGRYLIAPEKQRPVFLLGAPGIGKSAIIEQIARELDVGLVCYSMTHHTRQSALGLPYIEKRTFGGREYAVSEYTMSEIIASVYKYIERTGKKEGILFLDEINCVSETLAPAMLQFLQYKTFGTHEVPPGWLIVTAGNPPEYNRSVREFDIATLDRIKKICVEPDFRAWRDYAVQTDVHPAVLAYLDVKPQDFYRLETTVAGKSFVTARGWEDLSVMLRLYEEEGMPVDPELISQYLQFEKICADFADFYTLYEKYGALYRPEDILEGRYDASLTRRLAEAPIPERLSVAGLLWDRMRAEMAQAVAQKEAALQAAAVVKEALRHGGELQEAVAEQARRLMENGEDAALLWAAAERIKDADETDAASEAVAFFREQSEDLKRRVSDAREHADRILRFLREAFGDGQELTLVTSVMAQNRRTAAFLQDFGCDEYFSVERAVRREDREQEILSMIAASERE